MKKYTRFDLESAMQLAWQTSDDLDIFFKYHGDAEIPMTEDEVANALLGLKLLHDMRCWNANDVYCRVFELNQYCTDPDQLAARDQLGFPTIKQKKDKKK
jgi:hypothetical protein